MRSALCAWASPYHEIPVATPEQQAEICALVDGILALYDEHGYPLPAEAAEQLAELEREIDEGVAALYGL